MQKILAALAMALVAGAAAAQTVDFTEPKNGAVVSSPFKVKFAVTGMEVKPAGSMDSNTGHHHLIINGDSMKVGESISFDEKRYIPPEVQELSRIRRGIRWIQMAPKIEQNLSERPHFRPRCLMKNQKHILSILFLGSKKIDLWLQP